MPPKAKSNGKFNPGKKVASGHKLAEALPEGEIILDLTKGQWRLGKPIGSGGFGLIYLANRADCEDQKKTYVMKLEPQGNGPLFCEIAFYQRVAKPDLMRNWLASHDLSFLGIPPYIAAGIFARNSQQYRMLVMDRFGDDLQKLFEQNDRKFPTKTVFSVGTIVMNALEYMHENEYVHADIKAANLLRGYAKQNEVYLVDFGLAFRYRVGTEHKAYKEEPGRVHDGTIEFTSRDAHKGVAPARRGDLEILGYCMLQWLCGRLPWESNLDDKEFVRNEKLRYMQDISRLFSDCFAKRTYPVQLKRYLEYVAKLKYDEKPDYDRCRSLFHDAIVTSGATDDGKLIFEAETVKTLKTPKAAVARSRSPAKKGSSVKKSNCRKRPLVNDSDEESLADDEYRPAKVRGKLSHSFGDSGSARKSPVAHNGSSAQTTSAATHNELVVASPSTGSKMAKTKKVASKRVEETVSYASAGTQTTPGRLAGLRKKKTAKK